MAKNSRLWLVVNALSVGVITVSVLVLVDTYVIELPHPLTPKRARATLSTVFPDLVDAEITESDGRVYIGDCSCDLSECTWHRYCVQVPKGFYSKGHFERCGLGSWKAVEETRLELSVCIIP
jgi:hypothetical protein